MAIAFGYPGAVEPGNAYQNPYVPQGATLPGPGGGAGLIYGPGIWNPGQTIGQTQLPQSTLGFNPYGPGPAGVGGQGAFLPSMFQNPYTYGISNAMDAANWSSQAIPQAAGFQQALYGPGLTPMEQNFIGASGALGQRALSDTQAKIGGMFENSAAHSGLAPAMFNAANQFGEQMNQMAGQMGTQRQAAAAQALPFTFGFPIQAGQAAQQGAEGLYGQAQNAIYGDLQFPLALHGSTTLPGSTVIAQPGGAKGGK